MIPINRYAEEFKRSPVGLSHEELRQRLAFQYEAIEDMRLERETIAEWEQKQDWLKTKTKVPCSS